MDQNNEVSMIDALGKTPSFAIIDESNLSEEFLAERCQAQTPVEIMGISK